MSMMMEMMTASTKGMQGLDMAAMQECIEACSAAEQACTMCADGHLGDDMMKCSSMCMDCADLSHTMMRMMLRPNGYDMMSMMATLEACRTMAMASADECMKHADMSDLCRMCAQACTACAEACEKMMTSMKAMMPAS
jgi:hypothetical protein